MKTKLPLVTEYDPLFWGANTTERLVNGTPVSVVTLWLEPLPAAVRVPPVVEPLNEIIAEPRLGAAPAVIMLHTATANVSTFRSRIKLASEQNRAV